MNLNDLKALYTHSPSWIKSIYAKIPYNLRNGSTYREWNNFLKKEFEEAYPLVKLRETLYLAQNQIPFYQKIYSNLSKQISFEFNSTAYLEQLPIIDKSVVKKHYNEFINPLCNKRERFFVLTGGSSGEPMKFLQSRNVWFKELAFVNSIFYRLQYNPTILKASFRGVQFSNLAGNKYWQYNPINHEIQLSPFHLNNETIEFYLNVLNERKPKYLHGYPSAILNFIRLIKEPGKIAKCKLDGVFLISENYDDCEIKEIRDFFKCKILSFYGHSERLIIAPTIDEDCEVFELDQRYGYFELLTEDNELINEYKTPGIIVGTSFDNYAMPLIRYKTGDYTELVEKSKNRVLIGKILGRWKNEFLIGKNDERLTLTAINFHSEKFDGINTCQFYQVKPGCCRVLITSNEVIKSDKIDEILTLINNKIGHAVTISITQIDTPILTHRGKFLRLLKDEHINIL